MKSSVLQKLQGYIPQLLKDFAKFSKHLFEGIIFRGCFQK